MSGAVTNRTYRVWGNRDYRFKPGLEKSGLPIQTGSGEIGTTDSNT